MAQVALSVSIVAAVLSILSCLISIGTASRLQRRWVRSAQVGGVGVGDEIGSDVLARVFPPETRSQLTVGPTMIAFVSSGCRACTSVIDQLNGAFAGHSIPAVMIEPASLKSLREQARFEAFWMLDDLGRGIQAEFGSQVSPHTFVLVNKRVVGQQAGSDITPLIELVRPRQPEPSMSSVAR